jgi:hypothetical protein
MTTTENSQGQLPDGWQEVESATIRAADVSAVRWTGDPLPDWRPVIQIERAAGADHVWMHMLSASRHDLDSEQRMARLLGGFSESAQLTVPDLLGLRQVIDRQIAAIRHDQEEEARENTVRRAAETGLE